MAQQHRPEPDYGFVYPQTGGTYEEGCEIPAVGAPTSADCWWMAFPMTRPRPAVGQDIHSAIGTDANIAEYDESNVVTVSGTVTSRSAGAGRSQS